jgi:hypothetical protein
VTRPGAEPAIEPARVPGLAWGDLVEQLVAAHGTLTAVAWKLVERTAASDDVASVERALRRLRTRGQRDGGVWGQRLVRVFGVPVAIEDRVRWLGLYHSPFNDLPVPLCLDQLRGWDRPPLSGARARVWLHLGYATCALRVRDLADGARHAARARGLADVGSAQLEVALVDAYIASRIDEPAVAALLAHAHALLPAIADPADHACFAARLVDHEAYALNRAGAHAEALARYASLPGEDVHPFASYRRDAGLAYGAFRTGDRDRGIALAQRAIQHAGDGGYTRLRAMGLLLLAHLAGDVAARERARAIATRLGDVELLARAEQR